MSRDFVTHLECAYTGEIIEKGVPHTLSSAGKPILVRYDLAAMREEVTREDIETSEEAGFWRYSPRSEEHTSELQSRTNLVCRLLLEKKKKKKQQGTR